MTIRLFAATAAALAISAGSAFAADLGIAPVAEQLYTTQSAYDWTGFYIGVNGGYGWSEIKAPVAGAIVRHPEGWTGGAQVGYNYAFDGFVLGAEADLNISDIHKTEVTGGIAKADYSLEYYGTVRARAGYAIDRFLPYVTGGLAYGRFNSALHIDGVGQITDQDMDHVGWAIGAGAEYAVTDNLSLRAEYLYADFGEEDYPNVSGALVITQVPVGLTMHTARVGLNYKF